MAQGPRPLQPSPVTLPAAFCALAWRVGSSLPLSWGLVPRALPLLLPMGAQFIGALMWEGRNCQLCFTSEALRLAGVKRPVSSGEQGQSTPGLLEPKAHEARDIGPMLLTHVLPGAAWGSLTESRDLHS